MGVTLPRWVWTGAAALAAVAGMVNVIGLLGFEHQAVTHQTGTTTLFAAALVHGEPGAAGRFAALLAAFVAGATVSGMIIQDATLRLGRRYGVVLALESVLLFASVPLFQRGHFGGMACAAMACGLQNAMATTYSGAVIRTSHVSGMFTDLGIGLGHALRRMPLAHRRLRLCALIIAAFFVGGLAGAWGFASVGYAALLLPATLTGLAGVGYAAYRHRARQQGEPP